MAEYKTVLFEQLVHCPSKKVAKIAQNTQWVLPSKSTMTVIMEYIVCHIMLARGPSIGYWRSLRLGKVMQLPVKIVKNFEKLCEISYKRCKIEDGSKLPEDVTLEFVQAMHKEKRLFPFFDDRTVCDIYLPAPMDNLFILAAAKLEKFLAAIHLLSEPVSVVQQFANSVFQNGKNENVLLFYCGLARKNRTSSAYQSLPQLLEYMWHEITDDDAALVTPRLKIVIRCYYEANNSTLLRAFKRNSKTCHFVQVQNSFSPLGCFLSSDKGQYFVENYISGYRSRPLIEINLKMDNPAITKRHWLSYHIQNLIVPQSSSAHKSSHDAREDLYEIGRIVMPSSFMKLPTDRHIHHNYEFDDEGSSEGIVSSPCQSVRNCQTGIRNHSAFYVASPKGVHIALAHSLVVEDHSSAMVGQESQLTANSKLVTMRFAIPELLYPVISVLQPIPSYPLGLFPYNQPSVEATSLEAGSSYATI